MSTNNAVISCNIGEISPTGDCKPSQHLWLQSQVESNCKIGERRCIQTQDCETLFNNLSKNYKCANARKEINTTCYRGGDEGHITAFKEALNAASNCQDIINRQCKRGKPEPVPEPVIVPIPDKSFMKKMEELTGLTGAALIIYLIISEGSRAFLPRNAIPVP